MKSSHFSDIWWSPKLNTGPQDCQWPVSGYRLRLATSRWGWKSCSWGKSWAVFFISFIPHTWRTLTTMGLQGKPKILRKCRYHLILSQSLITEGWLWHHRKPGQEAHRRMGARHGQGHQLWVRLGLKQDSRTDTRSRRYEGILKSNDQEGLGTIFGYPTAGEWYVKLFHYSSNVY